MHKVLNFSVPAKIAVTYVIISLLYIYFSDSLLELFDADLKSLSTLQSVKGSCFVLLTGGMLYLLIKRYSYALKENYDSRIQERKHSFDELKKSKEKYWTVFNSSPIPMWIYDIVDLRFLLVNEAACRKYGYTKDEFYRMGINDICPQDDLSKLWDAVAQARDTRHKVWAQPYNHLCKDGRQLRVSVESAEMPYENHTARLVIATDVTEKIKDEEALAVANRRLRAASDIAKLGYWSNDLRSFEIYWSDALYDIFEIDKAGFELNWENVQNLFREEDRPKTDFDTVFINSEVKEFERRIITGKGTEKWVLERISLLRNEEGVAIFVEGITVDITERKHALQALENSNERFKMVAKAAVEAIMDWDMQTGTVYWGDGFQELFGYDPATCERTLWTNNIHPEDKDRVLANLAKAITEKATQYFFDEFRFVKQDGQFAFVEHRGVFIRNNDGVAIRAIGAMTDVTQLKERMIKIEQQNKQLKEIAWIQSHVVRAPLANLVGLTSLLKDSEQYDVDPAETIEQIVACAEKLDGIIHDIVRRSEQVNKSAIETLS